MSIKTKPKEISQAQAKGMARDLLAGLAGSGAWQESLRMFEALSPGNRRTVVDAISQAIGDATKIDPERLLKFAMTAIRIGRSTKPDFAVTLIQCVIDLCGKFGAQGAATSSAVLAVLLTRGDGAKKEGFPDGNELDLGPLARSPSIGEAVSDLFEDGRHEELLKHAVPAWGRLVSALVAFKGPACGLRPAAAAAVLRLISEPTFPLPVDIVLSANWLCQIAGGVPEELARRTPFQFLLLGASPVHAASTAPTAAIAAPSLGTPRAQLLSAIDGLLNSFESEIDQRRAALSGEVTRLTGELAAREENLEKCRSEVLDLRRELSRERERTKALNVEVEGFAQGRETLLAEIGKWKKEVDVLLGSRSNQLEQAKSDCRREFVKAINTNLKSLRGFLLELKSPDGSAPGSLAATALDEIIRVLHRQQFLTPEELPRLQ